MIDISLSVFRLFGGARFSAQRSESGYTYLTIQDSADVDPSVGQVRFRFVTPTWNNCIGPVRHGTGRWALNTSENTKLISDALSKMHGSMPNVPKNGKSNYGAFSTLDDGLEIARQHCAKNGISFTQATRMIGDVLFLYTRVSFGNEWIESEYPVIKFPARAQEIGSAMTYARRYSLFPLLGIAGENDDDGAQANANPVQTAQKLISEDQLDELIGLITETGSDPQAFMKYMGVQNMGQIKSVDFSRAKIALMKKKEVANG